jgi:transposase
MTAKLTSAGIHPQENDASDAAAICEAVTQPSMRFVGLRPLENRAVNGLNGLRSHVTKVDVIAPLSMITETTMSETHLHNPLISM